VTGLDAAPPRKNSSCLGGEIALVCWQSGKIARHVHRSET
jgi:hypothetical protein